MSSTNHTTNYNLPQFLGSDKPAWLGDINPAMSAIDTAMHANATTAAQGVSDAATAQTAAETADTKATTAQTAAETAQTSANQAISNSNTNASKIAALEARFILNNIQKVTNMDTGAFGNNYDLTLAQNSDGSVFKFYGSWEINNSTNAPITFSKPQVPGLTGVYGFATGVYLTTPPDEAYRIYPTGEYISSESSNSRSTYGACIAVGTNGQIYMLASDVQVERISAGWTWKDFEYPALYFNTNWGDAPNSNS